MRFITLVLALLLPFSAFAQSSPGLTYGQVPTAGQWNSYFAAKQDSLGYIPVNRAGDTMLGKLRTAAPTTSAAGLSLLPGLSPTSPIDGDMWITSSGLFARINGGTVGPLSSTTGTVTSVGVTVPAYMAVTGSPITSSGTLDLSFPSQAQNLIFSSPSGSSGSPSFRAITAADIAANLLDNTKLAQVATSTFKGRTTAGTGNVEDLTATQATALLNSVVGDSGSGGTKGLVPAPAAGDNSAGKFLKANGTWAAPPSSQTVNGYLYGLTLSNDATDPTNDIDIALGAAGSDDTSSVYMSLSGALIKRTDAAWAVGTNQGGWLDGASMPNGTGHVFLIQRSDTGVVDIGISASLTPTLPTNYDRKRRIGSIIRSSGAILAFRQFGNRFMLSTTVSARSSTAAFADAVLAVTAPAGIRTRPILTNIMSVNASSSVQNAFGDGDASATQFIAQTVTNGVGDTATIDQVYTNTSSQIRYLCQINSGTIVQNTLNSAGWVDDRGISGP